jgi:hypothetical protein
MTEGRRSIFWEFSERRAELRGRTLATLMRGIGLGGLEVLWREQVAVPHLGTRQQEVLGKGLGLPWQFLGFLMHSGDELKVTVSEAESLAAATDRRYHASLGAIDYRSMLAELRCPKPASRRVEISECDFCGTQLRKPGRCPDCMRVNGVA